MVMASSLSYLAALYQLQVLCSVEWGDWKWEKAACSGAVPTVLFNSVISTAGIMQRRIG
jgi:hypothetical protein